MKIKVDKEKNSAVIHLPKKVIREQTAVLSKEINELLGTGITRLVFNLEKTILLDSASLVVLIYARKNYPQTEVEMVIAGAWGYGCAPRFLWAGFRARRICRTAYSTILAL